MSLKNYLQQSILLCSSATFLLNMNMTQAAEIDADQPVYLYNIKGFKAPSGVLSEKSGDLIDMHLSNKVPCPRMKKSRPINPDVITELSICKEWTQDLVYDQGDLGSCTANASMNAVRMLSVMSSSNPHVMVEDRSGKLVLNPDMLNPSRLYQYYNTRYYEANVNGAKFDPTDDTGASIIGTVLALDKYGCCPEKIVINEEVINLFDLQGRFKFTGWNYDPKNFHIQPDPDCYHKAFDSTIDGLNDGTPFTNADKILNPYARISKALQYKDLSSAYRSRNYKYLNTPEEQINFRDGMLRALTNNHPVLIGLSLDKSFMHPQKGFIPTPALKNFSSDGGHAMFVVGYGPFNPENQKARYWKVYNSWGGNWGVDGVCFIEDNYLNNVNFFGVEAHEIWLNPAVK